MNTIDAYCPPNPKEFFNTVDTGRRTGVSAVLTLHSGSGCVHVTTGGITPRHNVNAAMTASNMPEAAEPWPVSDFTAHTSSDFMRSPKTRCSAFASVRSFSRVEVPCALIVSISSGVKLERSRAIRITRSTIPMLGAVR